MANRWCDQGAYAAYAATPTWGVPQEGDGLAKAAASASAIAAISFSAIPTSGTVTVMGVTISTTGVLNAASADAAANALAANINASATVVGSGISNTTPQLRNLVFARGPSGGAPAGTCQVMTRVGAAALNWANNSACLIATTMNNVSSSAATMQFSGGVSGCYGYFYNDGNIWPQALATGTYGLLSLTQKPLAGYPLAGDIVRIRARTLQMTNSVNQTCAITVGGTPSNPTIFDFDDGSEWPVDGPNAKFILVIMVNGTATFNFGINVGNLVWRGKRLPDGSNNCVIGLSGTNSLAATMGLALAGKGAQIWHTTYDGVTYNSAGTGGVIFGGNAGTYLDAAAQAQIITYYGCKVIHKRASPFFQLQGTNYYACNFVDLTVSNQGASVKNDGLFNWTTASGNLTFNGLKCENFIIGSQVFASGAGAGTGTNNSNEAKAIFKDTAWGNVTVRGPTLPASSNPSVMAYMHMAFAGSMFGAGDFFLDTKQGFSEFNSSRGQPTLNAVAGDGTPMSWRFVTTTQTNNISLMSPFELLRVSKNNTLANSQRTFTLEFCLEENVAWNKSHLWMEIEYTDTSGARRFLTTYDPDGGAFTASTSTWSQESNGKVTFIDGGTLYHNKYKLQITTPAGQDLALGSEVGITPKMMATSGNLTQGGFICPEALVA